MSLKQTFAALLVLLILAGCQDRRPPPSLPPAQPASESAVVPSSSEPIPDGESASPSQEPPSAAPQPPEHLSPEGDWSLVLVSEASPLAQEVQVELAEVAGLQFDKRAAPSFQAMVNDARDAGFDVRLISTYRSFAASQDSFDRRVTEVMEEYDWDEAEAKTEVARWIALPGHSEHNTGLAVDLVTQGYWAEYGELYHKFEEDPLFAWLVAHCAEYGFVLRYPKDKEAITGITYEPWHYRYVGPAAAREIMKRGLCLEEYLAER